MAHNYHHASKLSPRHGKGGKKSTGRNVQIISTQGKRFYEPRLQQQKTTWKVQLQIELEVLQTDTNVPDGMNEFPELREIGREARKGYDMKQKITSNQRHYLLDY